MTRVIAGLAMLGLLLAAPAALACDYDGDGDCTSADDQIINNAIGAQEGDADYVAAADYDGDGLISLADLGEHLDRAGK